VEDVLGLLFRPGHHPRRPKEARPTGPVEEAQLFADLMPLVYDRLHMQLDDHVAVMVAPGPEVISTAGRRPSLSWPPTGSWPKTARPQSARWTAPTVGIQSVEVVAR
jgi:hypothetical protein